MRHLSLWTIYDRPPEFPNNFAALEFRVEEGAAVKTGNLLVCHDIEMIRNHLAQMGKVPMQRSPGDAPNIVETWI